MKTEYAVLVGVDWADKKHDLCWREMPTGERQSLVLGHQPEQIHAWITGLIARHPGQRIAVCLEQSRGPLVYALMGYPEVDVYPVNPVTLAKYRQAFQPSGAKNDVTDARLALELLERHREALPVWRPDTEPTRLLRSLCEDRRKAVDARTALCNSLCSRLKEYFPQALELMGEKLYSPMACDFLCRWPEFASLAAAKPATVRKFYYAHHGRSASLVEQRLARIAASRPLTQDNAIREAGIRWVKTLVAQIRAFNDSIDEYDARIAQVFKAHPDQAIFASFPGAGKQLAPRLVAVFGTDRNRYPAALNVATHAGVAPVIEQSGQTKWTHWRWHCPTFLRQSLVEFAAKSILFSPWASVYYHAKVRQGKGHHAAVRALAFKWLRILFRCWKDQTPYDEGKYLAALKQHGSWIAQTLAETAA